MIPLLLNCNAPGAFNKSNTILKNLDLFLHEKLTLRVAFIEKGDKYSCAWILFPESMAISLEHY